MEAPLLIMDDTYFDYITKKYGEMDNVTEVFACLVGINNEKRALVKDKISNIKNILLKRAECQILEHREFSKWNRLLYENACAIRELVKAKMLKAIIRTFLDDVDINTVKYTIEIKEKSTLKKMLTFRYKKSDKQINEQIQEEWQRLLKTVPLKILVIYSLDIIKSLKGTTHTY